NSGRFDSVLDDASGYDVTCHFLHGLRVYIRVWHILHLPAHSGRSGRQPIRGAAHCGAQPTDVSGRNKYVPQRQPRGRRRIAMVTFWVLILAASILLYVLLDGMDLGVGILFGLTHREEQRHAILSTVAPVWDGNESWLVVTGVVLWGAFPP